MIHFTEIRWHHKSEEPENIGWYTVIIRLTTDNDNTSVDDYWDGEFWTSYPESILFWSSTPEITQSDLDEEAWIEYAAYNGGTAHSRDAFIAGRKSQREAK